MVDRILPLLQRRAHELSQGGHRRRGKLPFE